jgi:hypothetical protein
MANIVIVKNNTGSSIFIQDLGLELPGSGQKIFSDIFDFTEICVSEDLKSFVADSTFTINNGISDLTIADAIKYLECKADSGDFFVGFNDLKNAIATNHAFSLPISSTTSAIYQTKVSLTVGSTLEAGRYIILATADFQAVNNNKQVGVRLHNVTDNFTHSESIQQTNNSTNWFSFAGQGIIDFGGVSDKEFALQFVQISATTCNIRNAYLTFWRTA